MTVKFAWVYGLWEKTQWLTGQRKGEKSITAAEVFQEAFRKIVEENGSSTAGAGISLNRHRIVIDSQAVPDWFVEEYESTLSSMGASQLKSAFENDDRFFDSPPSALSGEALSRYAEVKQIDNKAGYGDFYLIRQRVAPTKP